MAWRFRSKMRYRPTQHQARQKHAPPFFFSTSSLKDTHDDSLRQTRDKRKESSIKHEGGLFHMCSSRSWISTSTRLSGARSSTAPVCAHCLASACWLCAHYFALAAGLCACYFTATRALLSLRRVALATEALCVTGCMDPSSNVALVGSWCVQVCRYRCRIIARMVFGPLCSGSHSRPQTKLESLGA
jgi:hypothetical protein